MADHDDSDNERNKVCFEFLCCILKSFASVFVVRGVCLLNEAGVLLVCCKLEVARVKYLSMESC